MGDNIKGKGPPWQIYGQVRHKEEEEKGAEPNAPSSASYIIPKSER